MSVPPPVTPPPEPGDVHGPAAGEMAALVRDFPWERTPLGPESAWPHSLRTVVRILLTSRFAMWMGWGPELTFLYNDAYGRMTLAAKHPWALGRPSREVWAEIWPEIGPRIQRVLETGIATWDEELQLFLERSGYREETYHTFSYSPLADDAGTVAGHLCVVAEVTEQVVGERRVATLRDLAAELSTATGEHDVLAAVERVICANDRDLPFTLVYLFEETRSGGGAVRARLACATGIAPGDPAAPATLAADDGGPAAWPVAAVLAGETSIVDALGARFRGLPTGAWQDAPERAVVAPLASRAQERPAGFLVAGVNPHRALDEAYRGFLGLVAGQIAGSLANARGYEEEQRRAAALAELDRAKTVFFSNVSHELRTPLTLMLGPTEDALRMGEARGAPPQLEGEALDVVHRNGLRLLRLVNSLLEFSRLEAGRVRARYEPTDLAAYTAELASTFRSAIERAGLTLVVDAPPLPAGLPPVYVDREMWERVVLNLLSNAFKHTFAGEIAVRVSARDGHAVLEVADTGVGIPPEQVARVFERFHRVPNARSRTHEGTGIGLALVQELVRLHGGTIDVASVVDGGTTFTVTVPLGAAHLPADRVGAAEGEEGDAPAGPPLTSGATAFVQEALRWLPDAGDAPPDALPDALPDGSGDAVPPARPWTPRVLVADDNADMRAYVARLLREHGWQVETAVDGAEALAAARADAPDLVLSDVMMPGLDGFALLDALRRDPATRTVPVVLLSARAGEEARLDGIEAGAVDYLVKPFSARELLVRVEAHLERAREAAIERRIAAERERLLAAVERERARLQELFAQAPAAIAVLRGPDHVFESANAPYMRFVGNRADVLGRPIRDALPELVGQGIYELLDTVYRTGEPYVGRDLHVLLDSDGDGVPEEHYFTFVYQPIRDEHERVSGIFVQAVDVTDNARARRAAEAANRAKSDFLASMSHELRTPLNAIGGYAELIELGIRGPVTAEQREDLARIQRSQRHLLGLISDILEYAKIEAGRVEYRLAPVPVDAVVARVGELVEPLARAKSLALALHAPGGAPDGAEPSPVALADPDRLTQVLLNLLSNAVKFTPAGGRIGVTVARAEGRVVVRVTDTGIGVPHDRLEAIFEPFVQVSTGRARPSEGVGLGLAISRDLARRMGGDLAVESAIGAGSTFTLTLPGA